jgi:hypothetical protein
VQAQFRVHNEKEYTMNQMEVNRFNEFYQRHLRLLKLQGKSQKTIDAYSRSVRRVRDHFDYCPNQLTPDQLEIYFAEELDVIEKILRHLDLWDIRNHNPPQKVSDYILELVCDETDSQIPVFDEWY